ncbi:MAG: TetR/AcrR family transcriptional regulator [Lachnospiraceae bacterium]|nr:TetR/AcrR family transcriptional regulator [Lachnospiraceae bacterium]
MEKSMNQRTRLTVRLFHESLLSLLKEKSIDRITVKELCEGAGLNRTTFYLHYGKPADVLSEIENELTEKVQAYLKELKEENAVLRMQSLLEYIRDNRGMFQAIMCEHGTDSFRLRFFQSIFPRGLLDKTLKYDRALRDYTDGYLVSGAFAAVYTWILNDCALSSGKLADLICGLSSNAVEYFRK